MGINKKNRFFRTTLGEFREIAIGKNFNTTTTDLTDFTANGVAGDIAVFFEDTNVALSTGDTTNSANAKRSFFYAWKQMDGTMKRTSPIPCNNFKIDITGAYNAGTAEVRAMTFGGTISVGQTIHVKVIETTGTHHPYPNETYSAKVTTDITTALASIVTKINVENLGDLPVTASKSALVLTLTAKDKVRTFKVVAEVETSVSEPDDLSNITETSHTANVPPLGTIADVRELERFFKVYNGGVEYVDVTMREEDLGVIATNNDGTTTQWGFILVHTTRTEKGGVVDPALHHNAVVMIAIAEVDRTALGAI